MNAERPPDVPRETPATISAIDSERFGLVVARAETVTYPEIPALLRFCEGNEVDLVIARCDGRDLSTGRGLVDAGMARFEAQIAFEGDLHRVSPVEELREGTERDAPAIAEIARKGFHDMPSHYHADPRLPLDACLEAYVDWSLRGLRREAADAFFVAELDDHPVGFMMFASEDDRIKSILSTIDPEYRGRNLYNAMFARGMEWGLEQGASSAVGVTPYGNIAAQRNLIRLGLRPTGSTATFHGWRDRLV